MSVPRKGEAHSGTRTAPRPKTKPGPRAARAKTARRPARGGRATLLGLAQSALGLVIWDWDVVEDRLRWSGDPSPLAGLPAGSIRGGALRKNDFFELLHPEDAAVARKMFVECLKGVRSAYRCECRAVWPDGSVHWVELYGRAEHGRRGRTVRIAGVVQDITERKAAELAVVRSEERLAAAFLASPDYMAISRVSDGRALSINHVFERETGYRLDEAIGRTTLDLGFWASPAERSRWAEALRAAGSVRDWPVQFRIKSGELRSGRISSAVYEADGEPVAISIIRDVTQQEEIARRSRESERKYAAVFEACPEAIAVSRERDSVMTEVNDAWARYSGHRRDEGVGRSALELEMWADPADRERTLARIAAEGRISNLPTRFRRADGELRDVLLSCVRLELQGEPHLVWAWRDVSEQRRIEAQVRELNVSLERRVASRTVELEAANRELESFSYSISHDLRAPLRAIAGFAEVLRGEHAATLDGEGLRLLGRIEQNASRMGSLIDDLLEFSRVGRGALSTAAVDMRVLVESVLADVPERGRAEVVVGELPPTRGDPVLLRQVWQNLIGNAFKFSRRAAQPRIEIAGAMRDGACEYVVRDNGAGFDMRYADKLFGVFQRLHSTQEFEGTGVGLAIVHRIVRRHGGTVAAESTPGRGATFRFALPA